MENAPNHNGKSHHMGVDMMRYKKYKEFLKEQDVGRDTKEKDSKKHPFLSKRVPNCVKQNL